MSICREKKKEGGRRRRKKEAKEEGRRRKKDAKKEGRRSKKEGGRMYEPILVTGGSAVSVVSDASAVSNLYSKQPTLNDT